VPRCYILFGPLQVGLLPPSVYSNMFKSDLEVDGNLQHSTSCFARLDVCQAGAWPSITRPFGEGIALIRVDPG
jgi:hypothetical protein